LRIKEQETHLILREHDDNDDDDDDNEERGGVNRVNRLLLKQKLYPLFKIC